MKRTTVVRVLAAGALVLTLLVGGLGAPAQATNLRFADPSIAAVWTRTDSLVAGGQVARSWYWGPTPGTILREPYADAPGGTRLVQYFDKSRMEINNPNGDRTGKFFVTNGLLTSEMISGKLAVGNNKYETHAPAAIPLASDGDDPLGPTYATFAAVSNTPLGDHPAPDHTNGAATATIDRAGTVGDDPSKAGDATRIAYYEKLTQHNVPKVFWNFLNQVGPVHEGTVTHQAPLSDPWTFTTGLPISEAYWADVQIAGQRTTVLIQAYERRVLTYIPTYAPAWQVQMNNAGQQYFAWRYNAAATQLSESLGRMDGAPSYHASSVMELAANGNSVRFAVQEADYAAPNKVYIRQTSVGDTGPLTSEVITIGATGWVSATDTAHTWVTIKPADVGADPSALNMAALIGVLQYAGNPQALGDETVNGVPSTHLRVTLDPAAVPSVRGLTWSAGTAEVWIAHDTRYLNRVKAVLTLGPGSVRAGQVVDTIDFRDFGKPVTIQPPK